MAPPINTHIPNNDAGSRLAMLTETQENQYDDFIWTWRESLLVIPLGLIVIGTIVGNFLVLYAAFTRSSKLRLPTHFLIANLSLADFLVGVLVMPFLTVVQLTGGKWYFGSVYCESWTVIHFWLCSASILSTCAICIERYIGVRFPLKHKSIMNTKRIWGMISCVWTLAGLLAFGSLYIWPEPKLGKPYFCEINQQIGHVIVAVVGILYVPAAIMIILYVNIYVIAKRHLQFMKKNSSFAIATSSDSSESQPRGFTSIFRKQFTTNINIASRLEQDSSTSEVSIGKTSSPRGSAEGLEQSSKTANSNNGKEKKGSTFSAISSTTTASNMAPSTTSGSTANWSPQPVRDLQSRKQINLAKRLSLLVGVLLATYLPFFTLYLVMAFHPGSIPVPVFMAFGWIRYFNSCINPFIYALTVPAYRKALAEIFRNGLGNLQRLFRMKERL